MNELNEMKEIYEEFSTDTLELIDLAEQSFLAVEEGEPLASHYDQIFRTFHNVKGSAGMLGLEKIQAIVHELETNFTEFKDKTEITSEEINYYLKGLDSVRGLTEVIGDASAQESVEEDFEQESPIQMDEASEEEKELIETVGKIQEILKDVQSVDEVSKIEEVKPLIGHVNYLAIMSLNNKVVELSELAQRCVDQVLKQGVVPEKAISIIERIMSKCLVLNSGSPEPTKVNEESKQSSDINQEKVQEKEKEQENQNDQEELSQISTNSTSSGHVKVTVNHLDLLMNLMGEMVLVRNQVLQYSKQQSHYEFKNLSQRLDVVTNELQEQIMQTRMQPIGSVLNRYTRVVRDLSNDLGKEIKLTFSGKDTELDRSLLEIIKDPLTHIIRNSCDHGIEMPEERKEAGKPSFGTIHIDSFHEGGQVIISISDDGKGLNPEKLASKAVEKGIVSADEVSKLSEEEKINLIFSPGFSTASSVTNLSGRGVGMDVVKSNLEKIGGTIKLQSTYQKGMTLQLSLPLTLAIVPALTIFSNEQKFVVPQIKLVELVRYVPQENKYGLEKINNNPTLMLRGDLLPLISLKHILGENDGKDFFEYYGADESLNIIVLDSGGSTYGLVVDGVEDTADIVVKPLSKLLRNMPEYSGVTVLGSGEIALILDVEGIASIAGERVCNQNVKTIEEDESNLTDYFDMLQFELNSQTKFGVRLCDVDRLEELEFKDIEYSGKQLVVKYRDSLLRLIDLNQIVSGESQLKEEGKALVIVVRYEGEQVGFIVNKILDVHNVDSNTLDTNIEKGIFLGRVVTDKGIISLLCLRELLTKAELIQMESHIKL